MVKCGDIVYVDVSKGDYPKSMSHFETHFVGVCGLNYDQQYGGGKDQRDSWSIFHPTNGQISWYYTNQLEVLKSATPRMELNARKLSEERSERGWKRYLKAIQDHIGDVKK